MIDIASSLHFREGTHQHSAGKHIASDLLRLARWWVPIVVGPAAPAGWGMRLRSNTVV
jgi:hypothetical protein